MRVIKNIWHIMALLLAAIGSLVYLLMLGYFALPTADDWGWARLVSDFGSFGFVHMFYYCWQGRFSALLIDGTLCRWLGWNEHLLLFSCVELILGYGAVYLLLRDLAKISKGLTLALASIIITNLGVMAFPEIGTFYWLCTSNYIHEIWFTMYLIWFIFCCHTKWLQWTGMLLCSLYLGGCAENYSPTLALTLGFLWIILLWRQRDWRFWRNSKLVLLLVSSVVIGVGSLFMILAPGNDVRMASEGSHSMLDNFSLNVFLIKSIKASMVLLLRLFSRGWYFLCALPILAFVGTESTSSMPKLTWKRFFVSFVVAVGFIVISVAATVLGVGWYATMRANCFITFVLMAWIAYVGILLGCQLKESRTITCVMALGASLAIISTACTYIVQEYPVVRKYNQDVVSIHHQMQQYVRDGRTEPVVVHPVHITCRQSPYGYLRNALQVVLHKSKRYEECYFPYEPFMLEPNPQDWRNLFYKQWLNAPFDIICVSEEANQ